MIFWWEGKQGSLCWFLSDSDHMEALGQADCSPHFTHSSPLPCPCACEAGSKKPRCPGPGVCEQREGEERNQVIPLLSNFPVGHWGLRGQERLALGQNCY